MSAPRHERANREGDQNTSMRKAAWAFVWAVEAEEEAWRRSAGDEPPLRAAAMAREWALFYLARAAAPLLKRGWAPKTEGT